MAKATEKQENRLQQTKSFFRLHGFIVGKDNAKGNNGYKEAVTSEGKKYRSLRFMIKTSEDNLVPVEMFGMVQDLAYMYNKKEKKTLKIKWADRFTTKVDGYEPIKATYDACEEIDKEFNDGDAVCVIGEIDYSKYTDKNGVESNQTKYIIKNVYTVDTAKHIMDFENEKFEEDAYFEQEIVMDHVEEVEGKIYVYANIIGYNKINIGVFELNPESVSAGFIKSMKSLKFGDFIAVNGLINNRAFKKEQDEEEDTSADKSNPFGKDSGRKSQKKQFVTGYIKSLEILGVDPESYEKKKYSEDELVITKDETKVKEQAKKTLDKIQKIEDEVNAEETTDDDDDYTPPFDLN